MHDYWLLVTCYSSWATMGAMHHVLAGAFSILVGAAGWFYLFYSRGVERLEGVEGAEDNRRRAALRRVGGVAMLGLAVLFYAGIWVIDAEVRPGMFVGIWLGIMGLLVVVLGLGIVDLRLTLKIRHRMLRRGVNVDANDDVKRREQ